MNRKSKKVHPAISAYYKKLSKAAVAEKHRRILERAQKEIKVLTKNK